MTAADAPWRPVEANRPILRPLPTRGAFLLQCSLSPCGFVNRDTYPRGAAGVSPTTTVFGSDMTSFHWLLVYCALIVIGSYGGGWIPSLLRLTHTVVHTMISFVGGLMLGVGLLHMLPHGAVLTESLDQAVHWMVAGLLTMFFLIRVFQFHQHETAGTDDVQAHPNHHSRTYQESIAQPPDDADHDRHAHHLSWVGVAVGLALHSLIDGIALGAAVVSEAQGHGPLPGFGIFLVVMLHKPLDALSITALMAASGWSLRMRQFVNVGFAAMCPLGAALFALGVGSQRNELIGCALAFSAGAFVCISLGDLLPELHFHSHDRIKLSVALLLGIAVAYAIGWLEPHRHLLPSHTHEPSAASITSAPVRDVV